MMQAHVTAEEILAAELALIQGIAFDLLCFHPYKAVLSLTEDLRTFLKSDKGKALVQGRPVSGQDLNPIYASARVILEDALLHTDLALLYTPGQIGLASLMVAQDVLHEKATAAAGDDNASNNNPPPLQIDWHGYVQHRFEAKASKEATWQALQELRQVLRQPKPTYDMAALKSINKKLKKVRAWSVEGGSGKKRKKEDAEGDDGDNTGTKKSKKRVKTE